MTSENLIDVAVNEFHRGNPQPLIAFIEAGEPAVMTCNAARELIIARLRGKGRPEEPTVRALRVEVVTFLYILEAYGIRADTAKDEAARRFSKSLSTITEIWKHHNRDSGYQMPVTNDQRRTTLWLRATSEGCRLRREAKRRDADDVIAERAYKLATSDLYGDDRLSETREAAASGELKRPDGMKPLSKTKRRLTQNG